MTHTSRAPDDAAIPGDDAAIPPGWSYDPSSWGQRLPIVGLALVGFAIAGYLGAFQLGIVADVWEPFFGPTRIAHYILGPIAVAAAIVAIWPATAALRWVNVLTGIGLMAAAVAFDDGLAAQTTSVLGGLLIGLLAFPRDDRHEPLGGGWRALWRPHWSLDSKEGTH